jgi:hypothetical protein
VQPRIERFARLVRIDAKRRAREHFTPIDRSFDAMDARPNPARALAQRVVDGMPSSINALRRTVGERHLICARVEREIRGM